MEYNIYAGLNGGFGGANYVGTTKYMSEDDANDLAYELACEEFETYEGHFSYELEEIHEIEDDDERDAAWCDFREGWIEYYLTKTSEDESIAQNEIIYLDDESSSHFEWNLYAGTFKNGSEYIGTFRGTEEEAQDMAFDYSVNAAINEGLWDYDKDPYDHLDELHEILDYAAILACEDEETPFNMQYGIDK